MILEFTGTISSGQRAFRNELQIPEWVAEVDGLWIPRIEQGSLNISFELNKIPYNGSIFFGERGARILDENPSFPSRIYLPYTAIRGNTITPAGKKNRPNAGDAQFWRAEFLHCKKTSNYKCYVMRRIESGYIDKVELIGDRHYRNAEGFTDGDDVVIKIYSKQEHQ